MIAFLMLNRQDGYSDQDFKAYFDRAEARRVIHPENVLMARRGEESASQRNMPAVIERINARMANLYPPDTTIWHRRKRHFNPAQMLFIKQ